MAQVTGGDRHKYEVMEFDECFGDAHRLLIKAADEWAKGNPEEPATADVLNDILALFEMTRFLSRPYGSRRGEK